MEEWAKKLARVLQRTSQSELAKACGVSPQHVCDVVAGRRRPRNALLHYLGFERVTITRPRRAA